MSFQLTDTSPDHPRMTPAVQALIAINVAFLFLQWTIVPAGEMASVLGFQPAEFPRGWWGVTTYLFVHAGFWHLASNMYALFVFGPRVEHAWGSRTFTAFYLWCGLGGVLFHALFARSGVLIGASAAVFGVMYAYQHLWPSDEVFLFGIVPMRVRTLVFLLAAMNVSLGIYANVEAGGSGDIAYAAHVGGFALAYLFLKRPHNVSIEQLRQRVSNAPDLSDDDTPRAIPRTRNRERLDEVDEVVAKSRAAVREKRPLPAPGVPAPREVRRSEADRVLDKISAEGLDSLSAAEKQVLEEYSRKLRGN
ncbi:MAG: Peptidase rhomboid domain protein [Gemmatimonadetes bacterium]|nr:Peptidase rhomboid domain protein [Gemmatimonadota bacterium]